MENMNNELIKRSKYWIEQSKKIINDLENSPDFIEIDDTTPVNYNK